MIGGFIFVSKEESPEKVERKKKDLLSLGPLPALSFFSTLGSSVPTIGNIAAWDAEQRAYLARGIPLIRI